MRARVVSCLFLLIALASPALAADRQGEGRSSFDRILPEIRRHTPGTFYDAEGPFLGQDGQARYRIKWMTPEGRIVWFDADAHTGRVLGRVPYPDNRSGNRFRDNRYDSERYGNGRYGDDRNDRDERNSGRFRDWPDYDRGQGDRRGGDRGDRGWGRGDRGRDGGGWQRGESGRGHRGRH